MKGFARGYKTDSAETVSSPASPMVEDKGGGLDLDVSTESVPPGDRTFRDEGPASH